METTFADRMRLAMDRAGLKPIELHEKTGISKPSISEYLSGNYEPKQRNLYKIAKALGVQPSYLMGITPLEPPSSPTASEKPHKADELDLTDKETHHIKLYRALDDEGRAVVDSVTETYAERARDTETSSVSTGIGKLA